MRTLTTLLGVCLPAIAGLAAEPVAVPVFNAGFEQQKGEMPLGWTLASGQAKVSIGPGRRQGFRSLRLANPAGGGETTVVSEPVKLQVGQLYRLSAWVRTEGVAADPTARYPTALGACLSMKSFPFTNASSTAAGTGARWVSVTFFATTASDRVQLHLGRNGKATGTAWFDGLTLEKVDDIGAVIPLETVRWSGKGFRYEDGGWTFLHIEGAPYERGYQHGQLMAKELGVFVEKLASLQDKANPAAGWERQRGLADGFMLRKYETEFLEEMKGIADGAAKAGVKVLGRAIDLLDVVTINSDIDLSEIAKAAKVTATPLSGRSFAPPAEDEPGRTDRCSSFIATKSATMDGRVVMGQVFMWPPGYTGVDWNVMVDVQPTQGRRFVMQTFAGGISSGTDWYINDAGLVIGETTVAQTPFEPEGTPEANRIRKAAQYATSIDQAAEILKTRNNGLYTNDWLIADIKTDEGADFLLGTKQTRMWRTGSKGHAADTPGGLKDFIWADNDNRSPEVRRELMPNLENLPVDLAVMPSNNRGVAFHEMYRKYGKGGFDLAAGVAVFASSPINRPHACDTKLTTSEMAEKLMFVAHYGKATLREKWVGGRWMADLPHATPHLTLGYTTFAPLFVCEKLKGLKAAPEPAPAPKAEVAPVKEALAYPRDLLWSNTVLPATDGDGWYMTGNAFYHALLRRLPEDPAKAFEAQRDALADLNARYAYFAAREGAVAPRKAVTAFDKHGMYHLPRAKGAFLHHQLRLLLGNAAFAKVMGEVHGTYAGKPMTSDEFVAAASKAAGRDLKAFAGQWLDRDDLPDPAVAVSTVKGDAGWETTLKVTQPGTPWHFLATVELRTAKGARLHKIEVKDGDETITLASAEKPVRVLFNAGRDLPVRLANPYTLVNQLDDFSNLLFVHGTTREVEASRSIALNYRELLADNFSEILPPIKPDAEVSDEELAGRDLVVFGGPEVNGLLARMAHDKKLPVTFGKGWFRFQGRLYAKPEDGLALAMPNPYNPKRTLFLYTANSRLELHQMLKTFQRGLPEWVVYRNTEAVARGFSNEARFDLAVE